MFDEYQNIMNEKLQRDVETAMYECRKILENKKLTGQYTSIIVDEGQDISPSAYRLLRSLAGDEHRNDIFIVGDSHQGKAAFARYLEILRNSFYQGGVYIEWKEEFYNYCIENIECKLTSKEAARQMVVDMINRRRKFFSAKPSYKKMGGWEYE